MLRPDTGKETEHSAHAITVVNQHSFYKALTDP